MKSFHGPGLVGLLVAFLLTSLVVVDESEAGIFRRRVSVRQRTTVSNCTHTQQQVTTIRAPHGAAVGIAVESGGGDVIEIVNRHRARFGLRPVVRVHLGAQGQAQQQHSSGSMHHSPFGGRENVAAGQSSAEQVVGDWMNSPGHRANILAADATMADFGHSGGFWTLRIR